METTLIVGAFVVVGITAVAISTFSDKIKTALNFKEQEGVNYEANEKEEEDRSVNSGGKRSRKKSKKKMKLILFFIVNMAWNNVF
jgi:hypothetical protein